MITIFSVTETVDTTLKELETEGKQLLLLQLTNKLAGIIALADTIKENAKEAIDSLKTMGIEVDNAYRRQRKNS